MQATRLLLVSTPRSGNTWFRRLLGGSLGLTEYAVHRQTDLNWAELPATCIVQMHSRVTAELLQRCNDYDFQPIVIVRHPLDVLISVLHFCTYESQTRHWLGGEGGDEAVIMGKDPTDLSFSEYAVGSRAAALLSASAEWYQGGVPAMRYEQLVQNTWKSLESFWNVIGRTPIRPVQEVIEENSLERSRATSHNHHFWMGRPGFWTCLIRRELAHRIRDAHAEVFRTLRYDVSAASDLSAAQVLTIWDQVAYRRTHSSS